MLKINGNNKINARDIYFFVEVKTPYYDWLRRCIDYADLKEGKDFIAKMRKSIGGRPGKDYEFTIDAAKEMCIVSATSKAKELRRWLIGISNKRENLDLVTVKEAALAVKVANALKYISNQKEAYTMHQVSFIEKEGMSKYIYSDFAKYRAKIVGWDKQSINKALTEYLNENCRYNRKKIYSKTMPEKLSIIDVAEAIRVSVLDILYSKGTDEILAHKFSKLVKEMSKELEIEPLQKNEINLFQVKEALPKLNQLKIN